MEITINEKAETLMVLRENKNKIQKGEAEIRIYNTEKGSYEYKGVAFITVLQGYNFILDNNLNLHNYKIVLRNTKSNFLISELDLQPKKKISLLLDWIIIQSNFNKAIINKTEKVKQIVMEDI